MPALTSPCKWPPLLVVGLTGGIASGKSTAARMLGELGATVVNADDEGRAVVEPGEPALAELISAFGQKYLTDEGRLDRRALGMRVFNDATDLKTLNRITHPRIANRLSARLLDLARTAQSSVALRDEKARIVVVEAAVLIEAGWNHLMDKIVVMQTQHSTQVSRLIAGPGLTATEAEARVHSQIPLTTRLRFAHFVLNGELPFAETQDHVRSLWSELRQLAARRQAVGNSSASLVSSTWHQPGR